LKRGALNVAGDFASTAGLLSETFGADDTAQNFYKAAEDFSLRAEKYVPTIGRVENVKSAGDLGVYAWEVLLENAPILASMLVPGGLVGKGAHLLTKSAIAGRAAGTTAAFLSDVGIQTGESVGIAREHGASPVSPMVYGSGLGKAALDFPVVLALANRLGLVKGLPLAQSLERAIFGELTERGYIKRAARASAGIVATEVPTEVTQEVMNIGLSRVFSQYEGQLTPEEKSQLLNAAAGATVFGLLGLPAGVRRAPEIKDETEEVDDSGGPDGGPAPFQGPMNFAIAGEFLGKEEVERENLLGSPDRGDPGITDARTAEFVYIDQLEHNVPALPRPALPPPEGNIVIEEVANEPQQDVEQAARPEPEYNEPVFFVGQDGTATLKFPTDPLMFVEAAETVSPDPTRPPGARWTNDPGAIPGEPYLLLDNGRIALIERQAANGNAAIEVVTNKGESLGIFPTQAEAVAVAERTPDPITAGLMRTAEQLQVASIYPEYLTLEPQSEEAQNLAGLHPGLQRALEIRDDFEADADNYRTTDGQMKKEAKRKLDKLNTRIAAIQAALGIDPASYRTRAVDPEGAQEPVDRKPTTPDELTSRQKSRINALEEKERVEGLSDREYEEYGMLLDIAAGKIANPQTRAQTAEELAELDTETRKALEEETVRRDPSVRHSVGRNAVEGGMSATKAKEILSEFTKRFRFGPTVRLLSPNHPDVLNAKARHKDKIKGLYKLTRPGEIIIVPEMHQTAQELQETYLHETMSHYGLRVLFTNEELQGLYEQILANPPKGINLDALRNVESQQERFLILEEYIAEIAEQATIDPSTGIIKETWWQRFLSFMRRTLRRMGMRKKWTDADLLNILQDVSKAVTGQITPYKHTSARQVRSIQRTVDSLEAELQAIDDYVSGVSTEAPRSLFAVDEIDVAETAQGYIAQTKLQLKGHIKTLREAQRRESQRGFFDETTDFAKVVGEEILREVNDGLDSSMHVYGARFAKWFFTPLQFASKYNVPGAQEFLEFVQKWWARKRILTHAPAEIAQKFMQLGPRNQKKLSEAILKISIESDERGRRLNDAELDKIFKELGMEGDTALRAIWGEVDASFGKVIENLREGLMKNSIRMHGDRKAPIEERKTKEQAEALYRQYQRFTSMTPDEKLQFIRELGHKTKQSLDEIDVEMTELLNRNYFPRMRFGQWAITIRAQQDMTFEGKKFEQGEVIYFETLSTQKEQRNVFEELQKEFGDKSKYTMRASKIADEEFHFMGTLSPELYDTLVDRLDLKEDAVRFNTLKEIYLTQSPGRAFLRHLTKRRGIAGYSEDVLRVYSSYMMNVANHIARVEYHLDMREQLGVIGENSRSSTPDARVASIVDEYFNDQFQYLMNPKNDLAQLRSLGFLWYLGFNVKSAVVNLTQVPMVAHSFLASRYGDAASARHIAQAINIVRKRKDGMITHPELSKWLNQAVREGFVDESRATELAGLAEQSTLQRLIPATRGGKLLQNTSWYGAFMFQKAERFNREITFIAAFNLAKENNQSNEQAYKLGREAVQTAMFEYAKWNRPAFMRGKKSVFFLFWQYMQGLSYIAFGGAGQGAAMRVWMMLLLAGGMQGLPFAENLLDIVDFVGTKSKEKLGLKNPRVDLREDLRELVGELTDRPDLVMHGLSRQYGLGAFHMLNMLGVPVPNVDISGSISVGRIIPGTDDLLGPDRDPAARLGRTMADAFGPVAGIGYGFWRAMTDTNVDTWKVWERTMPSAFKSMSQAFRRGTTGGETYRGGGTQTEFDWMDTEHRAELIANFLGFAPTRVNQRYEADFAVTNMIRYWTIRRGLVMENMAIANMAGDPEAVKDSRDALVRFNNSVPDPSLRIRGDQLAQSLKQRFRRGSLRERGIPSELLFRRVAAAMRDLYPEAAVEIE
jgi:hypothetical protein